MASKNLMQMSTDIVKLDRFDGGSFKRWQKKMQFLLATLKVAYVLTKPYPEESEDETLAASRERLKFEMTISFFVDISSMLCRIRSSTYIRTIPRPRNFGISVYTTTEWYCEKKNRTLMDMVNSMMSHSGLSSGYWGEALLTACYILNRLPSKRSIKTPYELWNQRTPKLDYLRIWGCRDARFDENRFRTIPKAHEISKETMSTEIPITTAGNNDDSFPNHQQVEPRRSTRQRRQRTFGPDFEMYLVKEDRKGLIRECNTPKMGHSGNDVPEALLHNTIAQVMRERPLSVV
ncbi:zinc finger, CCHC-type containing protein [Tanacetum coccineum]